MTIDNTMLSAWSKPWVILNQTNFHTFGQCMVIPCAELVYVNIPKNASTWTRTQLMTLGASMDNYLINNELSNKPRLVVLRDPIERWVSGISWYMTLAHPKLIEECEQNIDIRSTVISMVTTRIGIDSHTIPQSVFIQGIDFANTTFIRTKANSNDYRCSFSKFFKNELGIVNVFDQAPEQHVAFGNPIQHRWVNFFQSLLDSELIKKLYNYYQDDIDLINKINFYE
jgi:hypothetical protein